MEIEASVKSVKAVRFKVQRTSQTAFIRTETTRQNVPLAFDVTEGGGEDDRSAKRHKKDKKHKKHKKERKEERAEEEAEEPDAPRTKFKFKFAR